MSDRPQHNPFDIPFERLPERLPLFPLPRALVMPGTELPLNIFEPRYLNLVDDALAGARLIGMIQPRDDPSGGLHPTGGAGRIVAFSETDDGRYLILLRGVCRFDLDETLETTRGYLLGRVDWGRFRDDTRRGQSRLASGRARLLMLLRGLARGADADDSVAALRALDDTRLVNQVISRLDADPESLQALLETIDLDERAGRLIRLLELARQEATPTRH